MAEENTNSNNFKEVLLLPCVIFGLATVMGVVQLVGIIHGVLDYAKAQSEYNNQLRSYKAKMEELDALKEPADGEQVEMTASPGKEFYKPVDAGADPESMIANEFNEILQLMTANQIKTRSIKYDDSPDEDVFYKNAPEKFSVCKLDMKMIANYTNFKNFMKDLYKHDHYLDIAKIEIRPYNKNKTILLIDLQLRLYAQKV